MNYIYSDVVPYKVTFWAIGGLDFYIWIMGRHNLTCNDVAQKTLNTIETSKFRRDILKSKWESVWQSDDSMNTASFFFPLSILSFSIILPTLWFILWNSDSLFQHLMSLISQLCSYTNGQIQLFKNFMSCFLFACLFVFISQI